MAFDLSTARPVDDPRAPSRRGRFDITTARPVEEPPSFLNRLGDLPLLPMTPYASPKLREVPRLAANMASAVTAGIVPPEGFLGGPELAAHVPPITTGTGHLLDWTLQGTGMLKGLPGKLGQAAAGGVARLAPRAASSLLGRTAMRAAEGAALGATTNLREPAQMPARAAAGAALTAGALPAAQAAGRLMGRGVKATQQFRQAVRYGKQLEETGFRAAEVGEVRKRFLQAPRIVGKALGRVKDQLVKAHPDTRLNLSRELATVQQQAINNPSFKSALDSAIHQQRDAPFLQSLFNQPGAGATLTLKESTRVRQVLGQVWGAGVKGAIEEADTAALDAIASYHQIAAKEFAAFPQLKAAAARYRQAAQRLQVLKPSLSRARLEGAVKSNFGNRAEMIQAAKGLSPDSYTRGERMRDAMRTRSNVKRFTRTLQEGVAKGAFLGAGGMAGITGWNALKNLFD